MLKSAPHSPSLTRQNTITYNSNEDCRPDLKPKRWCCIQLSPLSDYQSVDSYASDDTLEEQTQLNEITGSQNKSYLFKAMGSIRTWTCCWASSNQALPLSPKEALDKELQTGLLVPGALDAQPQRERVLSNASAASSSTLESVDISEPKKPESAQTKTNRHFCYCLSSLFYIIPAHTSM